ncbi:MAG: hypothetical protein GWN00_13340 [Aliifodinibius sp.]|nr:hypothetical protein [Fodinibius sp.]NIV12120.1 hypothetical protein [Fodinibius sp.]NIY25753.1 hypothetical protein [Fodinibius sp.]
MAVEIVEVKRLVAPDVMPCPDPIIEREVISTILDFCKKSNVLQREFEVELDVDDIDDEMQNCIDINIEEFAGDLRLVSLLELMVDANAYIPYKRDIRTTITNYDYVKDEEYKYYWLPDNRNIRLFDMKVTDSLVWMKASFKPLRTLDEIDDFLFEDWSEGLVAGAKWKILSMPNKEWTDFKTASYYRSEYRRYLSQAKQAVVRGASGYSDRVNWKSFGEID